MSKCTVSAIFSSFIGFFILWEVWAASESDRFLTEVNPKSECRDLFSAFPKSSEGIPKYVEDLEAVLQNSGNIYEKELAVKFLGKIGVIQPDSASKAFQILINAFQSDHGDENDNRAIKGVAIKTATQLVLDLSSEKLSLELIHQLLTFIAETKNNTLLLIAFQNLNRLTKKYPQSAFFTVKSIFKIFGEEFKEDTSETSESQSLVPVSDSKKLNIFQRALRLVHFSKTKTEINPETETESSKIRKEWKKEWEKRHMQDRIDMAIEQCTEIVLQSPSAIQDEIAEFLKNIIHSDGYSKVHKDMALKIYGDFSLEKLDKLPHQ